MGGRFNMARKPQQSKSKCPECGEILEIDFYSEEGDIITCYSCDTDLEIKSLKPIVLKIVKNNEKVDDLLEDEELDDNLDDFVDYEDSEEDEEDDEDEYNKY
ncbi:hypothetical protein OMAG_001086 [Candidatus Omnitrophus magneticus]|uniref:Lysine biosynthesis protein LysW n=1 Tax=Candidatus Omnitrophus magneticus TaxID=1609969 RepID=A0A0F0CP43_9BACT|nr:hypothetical protein OMAG_001747 [Candidatus Omnitrophus magneticus]KJJ85042.1 hypothetical protein OMAG_001086 [Candidatus Omnitrophus magneticus]